MRKRKFFIFWIVGLAIQIPGLSQVDTVFCSINFDSTNISCNDVIITIIQGDNHTVVETDSNFMLIANLDQLDEKFKLKIEFDKYRFFFKNFLKKNFHNRIDFHFEKVENKKKILYHYTLTVNYPLEKIHKFAAEGVLYNTLTSKVKSIKLK